MNLLCSDTGNKNYTIHWPSHIHMYVHIYNTLHSKQNWQLVKACKSNTITVLRSLAFSLHFKTYTPHHNHFTLFFSWNCLYHPLLSSLFSQIFFWHHRNLALSYQMNLDLLMLEFLYKKEKVIHWNLTEHEK